MNAKDAIKTGLTTTQHMIGEYLKDLSDADLLERPAPSANHIAWQMGHLILAETDYFGKLVPGAIYPSLPAGFQEQHANTKATENAAKGFLSKEEYLSIFNQVRAATVAAVDKLTDADFDKPTGLEWAPTLGVMLIQTANHTLMHGGQFTVVRRKLGKPVIM